jgi:hypothetical protein
MVAVFVFSLLALQAKTVPAPVVWDRVAAIEPKGMETEDDFNEELRRQRVGTAGDTNWFTGRWPMVSFLGGMVMGNVSEDLEFFYQKPFKWSNRVLDYVMEGGGRKFGIRATLHGYGGEGLFPGNRSYLLSYRCDRLLEEYHPSYILVNGQRMWDCRLDPILDGKILIPFWQDKPGNPVIDFVTDLDYTPEVKGLALHSFDTQFLGVPGEKIGFRGASETAEGSPADKEERFAFGVFPNDLDFWSDNGPSIESLKSLWKPNFKPAYPTDPMWLSPFSETSRAQGPYHDFMVTFGGANVLGSSPSQDTLSLAAKYARSVLADPAESAREIRELGLGSNLDLLWLDGDDSPLVLSLPHTEAKHQRQLQTEREALNRTKAASGAPDRIQAISSPFPPALTSAYAYESGNDLLVYKNEEDPQYNILMSMARGAGRSYGKPFGFSWDASHSPFPSLDFKLQACLLYYLSGGSWIGAEAENAPSFEDGTVAEWAMPYVQALRFAMVHPARGTPIVPTAVCWGDGDRWWVPYSPLGQLNTFQRSVSYDHATGKITAEPAFVKPFPWMPANPHDWSFEDSGHLAYFNDHVLGLKGYDLLDVFFPDYGDALTARIGGLLTGTPYGPVDFLNVNQASPQTLQSYGLSIFLGETTLDAAAKQKLVEAAQGGQTIVLGAEQLGEGHGLPGLVIPLRDPQDLGGSVVGLSELFPAGRISGFAGKVYEVSPVEWETVATIGELKWPLLVRRAFGDGWIYVYLGRWTAEGGPVLRPLIHQLGAKVAPLQFGPADKQLEYVAYRKGAGAWLAIFNHGAIAVGADRLKPLRAIPPEPLVSVVKGPWLGQITFRLNQLGLDPAKEFGLYEVDGIDGNGFDRVISGKGTFNLRAIPFQLKDGELHAKVQVGKRAEYLIAPVGKAHAVFFGPK